MAENIVKKGEIACYKQFLLFSHCFPQLYMQHCVVMQNAALCGNGLIALRKKHHERRRKKMLVTIISPFL